MEGLRKESSRNEQLIRGGTQVQIAYNRARPVFADKRVRQALTYALDRKAIVDAVLYGFGQTVDSPIIGTSWAFDQNVPRSPYDVEAARRLLREAGWTPNAAGVLRRGRGPPAVSIITR